MTDRKNPFRLVGGIDASEEAAPAKRRGQPTIEIENEPEVSQPRSWRDRTAVARDIKGHIVARRAYQEGVAWLVAAEDQNLPLASIEAAREDVRTFYKEMVEAARRLVIVMPTDLKALCDLTIYLETNFSSLPEEVVRSTGSRSATPRVESFAFHLLRTVRLSLRHVAKYGKHGPTS